MEFLKDHIPFIRRSLLSVPADNNRALEKAPTLDCDGLIFDLEDSVAPTRKAQARLNLENVFTRSFSRAQEWIIRTNPLAGGIGHEDLELAARLQPDAVLIPKVEHPSEITAVLDVLEKSKATRPIAVWAMIETPKGVINAASIAADMRGSGCFVVGLNDLRKETGVLPQAGRSYLVPWLMQIVLAARAYGVDVIDSVFNDFRDTTGFDEDCAQGRAMGFSGKMLIHPVQIDSANRHFGPGAEEVAEAQAIVTAFRENGSGDLNVINIDGKMVERLHLVEAEKLLAKATFIAERKKMP